MQISGHFQNTQEVTWYVYFKSDKNPSVNITINDNSGVYFAPNAVEIITNYEDSFQHIIKRTATVNLVTDIYLGDLFFGYNARDIQVLIFRELELIFAGFIDPNQYNQTWAFPHDELTINCIDALSTLEYYKYHNIKNDATYKAYKQTADNTTPKQIIDYMLRTNLGTLDFVNNISSKIYWDQSKSLLDGSDIMENMEVSELLFLDEDVDSCWDSEQVLREVLQYLNLHIIQLGRDFFIYDNEYMNRIDAEGKTFKDLFSSSTLSKQITTSQLTPYTLQKSHYNSDDTNLTIGDVYNQIQIKCNLIDNEEVIESPFDDDNLTSPFPMRQIFATEAVAQGEGQRAKKAFWTFVKNGRYLVNQDDYDGVTVNDYYLQYMTNPNWVFYDGYNNNIDSYLEKDTDGNYYRQWKVPSVYPWVTGANPSEHGLVTSILSFGVHSVSGQAIAEDDSARMPNKLDQANYIVMSINGNQKHDNTHTPTDTQLQSAAPAAQYIGAVSGGVYSPPDDETINYIVFSGSIIYQPVEITKKSGSWTTIANMNSWGNLNSTMCVKYLKPDDDGENTEAYRTIKWFNSDYPDNADSSVWTTVDMLDPCFSNSIAKNCLYQYNYSYINGYHVGIDAIKNLGVIECEMIIGDKCLAEDWDEDGNSVYAWVDKNTGSSTGRKTFSLGINPKLHDYIIGQEFKIANNITFKMNLDNASGTAIPIKKSDNLSGKVEFKILGPINQMWNDITRRHSTWFRSEKFYDNDKYILSEVKNIVIKDFEAKFYSDNGGYTYNDGQDLIYMSIENDQYINTKSDIEFKINSALTSEECKQKQIKQGIRVSNPVYNGEAITSIISKVISDSSNIEAKAEELYIDQYYREYSKPRLTVEVSVNQDYMKDLNEIDIYGSITKLNSLNKAFHVVGINYDSETESRKLTLKEIGEAASGSDSTGNTVTLTYTIYATGNPLTVQDPTSLTYTWQEETDSTWYAVYTVEVDAEYADSYTPVMGFIDKMVLEWLPIMTTVTIPIVYSNDDPNNPSGITIEYSTTQQENSTHYTTDVVCTCTKEEAPNYVFDPNDFTPTDYTWYEIEFSTNQEWLEHQYLTVQNLGNTTANIIYTIGDAQTYGNVSEQSLRYKKYNTSTWNTFSFNGQNSGKFTLNPGEAAKIKCNYKAQPNSLVGYKDKLFVTDASNVRVYGNILSMRLSDDFINNISNTSTTFYFLNYFEACGFTDAENLVLPRGYKNLNSMFYNSTSLVKAPKTLNDYGNASYCNLMFYNCTSLTNPPVLPATTLTDSCYNGMFEGCTSLVNAPELPATTVVRYVNGNWVGKYCYREMFKGCTSLVNAPELPALSLLPDNLYTTSSSGVYIKMFYGCSSLSTVKAMFTRFKKFEGYEDDDDLYQWLQGVSSSGTFIKNPAATFTASDIQLPSGWTIEDSTD